MHPADKIKIHKNLREALHLAEQEKDFDEIRAKIATVMTLLGRK